jgi:hypothetical protein
MDPEEEIIITLGNGSAPRADGVDAQAMGVRGECIRFNATTVRGLRSAVSFIEGMIARKTLAADDGA